MMPKVKSAKKLYDICFAFLNKLILQIVSNIDRKYGPFSSLKCQIYLQSFQEYLLTHLHWNVLDNLLQEFDLPTGTDDNEKLMVLCICLHPDMRQMLPGFKLPPQDAFYIMQLKKLNKITMLDLTMVCTDEILKAVGDSCPLLEEIHIVSKVESVNSKTRRELNALKLKFFVSDEGLEHLHKCKNLKRIIMNKILRSNCGGRKITHDGIRGLLKKLPKLEYINYSDMGLVLEVGLEEVTSLNLLKLHDNHISPLHIEAYGKLCPKLRELCLKVPMTIMDQTVPNECMAQLAESDLKLSALELGFFPFEYEVKKFFQLKGNYLTNFSIFSGNDLTTECLFVIGKCCPNLELLELKILQPSSRDTLLRKNNVTYFSELKTLHLIGVNWDPTIVFPLCIHNASNLRTLGLINREYEKGVDSVFERLLHKNPLINLKNVCLHEGFTMKKETIETFLFSCKSLDSLTLSESLGLLEYVEHLKAQFNFDMQVQCEDAVICSRNCNCYNRSSSL